MIEAYIILITIGFCTCIFGTWIQFLRMKFRRQLRDQKNQAFERFIAMKFKLENYATHLENKLNKLEGHEKENSSD